MRRFAASLLFLFFALRMLMPALPVFVCHEMGGMHVLGPCCSSEELGFHEAALLSARCCEQEDQLKVDLQRTPQIDLTPILQAPLLFSTALLSLPAPPTSSYPPLLRDGPPPIGPPPPLRQILLI